MSSKRTAGSAEFVVPEEVSIPESRHYNSSTAGASGSSGSGSARRGSGAFGGPSQSFARDFADGHRYQHRYTAQVNMLTDHFAPSALYLARKADPQPYTALTAAAIQTHVQPTDYSLRPPSYASQQAVVDFYRACKGRYGVSVNFDSSGAHSNNTSGGGGGSSGTGSLGPADATAASSSSPSATSSAVGKLELLTLGSHAHGGRGLAESRRGHASQGGTSSLAVSSAGNSAEQDPSLAVEDFRLAQLRRNVQHVDTQVCLYYGTKEGCRRGDQCEFLHVNR